MRLGVDSTSLWTLLEGWTPFIQKIFPLILFWWWWRALSNTSVQNLPWVFIWVSIGSAFIMFFHSFIQFFPLFCHPYVFSLGFLQLIQMQLIVVYISLFIASDSRDGNVGLSAGPWLWWSPDVSFNATMKSQQLLQTCMRTWGWIVVTFVIPSMF